MHNTGVQRADWKGLVERSFGLVNENFIKFIPGYVPPVSRARDNRDYDLKAACSVDELRKLLAYYVLHYNTHQYLEDYRADEQMVANHVPRYPLDLWNWGIKSRGGRLMEPSRDIVRLNLLPRKQASITPRGIHFVGDLYYECDTALRENWFVTARKRGHRKIEVAFDPRTTARIYLPLDNGSRLEVCTRTEASMNLPAMDWHDAMDYFTLQRAAVQASASRRVQSAAALEAQRDAVVAEATEKTRAALAAAGNPSKKSRRAGIRDNRAFEKQLEQERTSWSMGVENTDNDNPPQGGQTTTGANYLPPSSKLTRIEALLENQWSNA